MKLYIAAVFLLLIIDLLWLKLFMKKKYETQVFTIQNSPMKPRMVFAVLAYILLCVGLVVFVLPNIDDQNIIFTSLKYGFLFGIVLYGVYDFTIAAVLKDWDIRLAMIDVLWGGFLYFSVSVLYGYMKRVSKRKNK